MTIKNIVKIYKLFKYLLTIINLSFTLVTSRYHLRQKINDFDFFKIIIEWSI